MPKTGSSFVSAIAVVACPRIPGWPHVDPVCPPACCTARRGYGCSTPGGSAHTIMRAAVRCEDGPAARWCSYRTKSSLPCTEKGSLPEMAERRGLKRPATRLEPLSCSHLLFSSHRVSTPSQAISEGVTRLRRAAHLLGHVPAFPLLRPGLQMANEHTPGGGISIDHKENGDLHHDASGPPATHHQFVL